MTENNEKNKQLLKILYGAAWIDGEIQPEEREYLNEVATKNDLSDDPEIQSLLIRKVEINECYRWLEEYIKDSDDKEEDFQELLESISGLIYSDQIVDTEEAKLLNYLQNIDFSELPSQSFFDSILKGIREFYQKALNS